MAEFIASLRYCTGRCLQPKPPDPVDSVLDLLGELKITPRQVHEMYRLFYRLKQHDSIHSHLGQHEVSSVVMQRLIRSKRDWVGELLSALLNLANCRESITWDAFLFVFLQFCTLSKIEMCQVVFYIIALQSKSWTIHFLTTTQLEEFYSDFLECPVKAFNTQTIDFSKLPSAKYYVTDFIGLGYRFSQLINPFLHIQRELQRSMPSIPFWSDFDNRRMQNRKINIDFFRHRKVVTLLDVINKARQDMEKNIAKLDTKVSPKAQARGEFASEEETIAILGEQTNMKPGFIPIPFGAVKPPREPRALHKELPKWMKDHLADNADPVRGLALGSAAEDAMPAEVAPVLPVPWVAVPDPERPKRLYYWNQETDEVSWMPPKLMAVLSVEEAKDAIRSSMGAPLHRQVEGGLDDGLVFKALVRSTQDRETAMRRTLELDFVTKARNGEPKRADMVTLVENSRPCELLKRPRR